MPRRQPINLGGRPLVLEGQLVAPGPADVQPTTHPVRVTEKLKRAAAEAHAALASVDPWDVHVAQIEVVSIKYETIHEAGEVARLARSLAGYLAARCTQMQINDIGVVRDGDVSGRVEVPVDLLLPKGFEDLIGDAAKTELELLDADAWLVEAARQFVSAFAIEGQVRIDLFLREGQIRSVEFIDLEDTIPRLHKAMRGFAKALGEAVVTEPHHQIRMIREGLTAVCITDHEEAIDFGKKKAPLRALLTLALLRCQPSFTVEEFAALYLGKEPTDSGKAFDNGMSELCRTLSDVDWEVDSGNRSVVGLLFKQVPSEGEMREVLGLLYRE